MRWGIVGPGGHLARLIIRWPDNRSTHPTSVFRQMAGALSGVPVAFFRLRVKVLKRALGDAGLLPKRSFASVEEFSAYFQKHKSVILDGTEQRMQRPGDKEEQKAFYSGKKKHIPPSH